VNWLPAYNFQRCAAEGCPFRAWPTSLEGGGSCRDADKRRCRGLWTGLAPEGYILALPRTEGGLLPSHGEFGRDLAFLVQKIQAASGIEIPALLFPGSHGCVTPPAQHQIPMYEALASACKTHVTITGASHCQFADYNITCSLGEGGCPSPAITRAQQHAMTLEFLLPWLDFTLKGEPEGWTEFQQLLDAASGIAFAQACEALSADEAVHGSPRRLALACSPNPLRGAAVLSFTLLAPATVEVSIRDPLGRTVRGLTREQLGIGRHSIPWDGRDDAGRELPAGVYWGCLNDQTRKAATGLVLVR